MASLVAYATTASGYIESGNVVYATARTGSNLSASTGGTIRAGQTVDGGSSYLFLLFLALDTSAISNGTINTAVLDMWAEDKEATTAHTLAVATAPYDWASGGLTGADWFTDPVYAALVDVATLASGSTTEGQYNTMSDTGPGLASVVNKTGITYLVGYTTRQKAGTVPTNAEFVIWQGGGVASPAPRITIDYTPGVQTRLITPSIGNRAIARSSRW